jgi:general secretion pathway protein J
VKGFTLVEVLVALVVLALTGTLVLDGLRLGARSARAAEERARRAHDFAVAASFVKRGIERARRFSGERDSVRFVAPLPAHLGEGGLYSFTVVLERDGDASQLLLTFDLREKKEHGHDDPENPLRHARSGRQSIALLRGIGAAEFAYLGVAAPGAQAQWQPRWEEEAGLPRLVRVRLIPDDGSAPQALVVAPRLTTARPEG